MENVWKNNEGIWGHLDMYHKAIIFKGGTGKKD